MDTFRSLPEHEQEDARLDEQRRTHPACEICNLSGCASDEGCCPAVRTVVKVDGVWVHTGSCRDKWTNDNEPTETT